MSPSKMNVCYTATADTNATAHIPRTAELLYGGAESTVPNPNQTFFTSVFNSITIATTNANKLRNFSIQLDAIRAQQEHCWVDELVGICKARDKTKLVEFIDAVNFVFGTPQHFDGNVNEVCHEFFNHAASITDTYQLTALTPS